MACFPVNNKRKAPFTRLEIVTYLEKNQYANTANFHRIITKQPGFSHITYRSIEKEFPVSPKYYGTWIFDWMSSWFGKPHLEKISSIHIFF